MSSDTVKLPITNSPQKGCKLDTKYAHWFTGKQLHMDNTGVYYHYHDTTRKLYIHNQVMALAVADGSKDLPPAPTKAQRTAIFTVFLLQNCDPDVVEYVQNTRNALRAPIPKGSRK